MPDHDFDQVEALRFLLVQRKIRGTLPTWWQIQTARLSLQPANAALVELRSFLTTVRIESASRDRWQIAWTHGRGTDECRGHVMLSTNDLRRAFRLPADDVPPDYPHGFLHRPGAFIRDDVYLTVPDPEADGQPARRLSIWVTPDIEQAVAEFIAAH